MTRARTPLRLVLAPRALRGAAGSRLGTSAGASLEFHDYRDYQPGDDVRLIDWNVYARTDREMIRRHREEVSPVLDLRLDVSASMSGAPQALSDRLAEILTDAAKRVGCQVRRSTFAPQPSVFQPFSALAPRSVRVLISDLLLGDDPASVLASFAQGAAAFHVIRVLPAFERNPPPDGLFHCVDAETGEARELAFDAATRAAHADALRRHTESWGREIRRFGGTFTDFTAETETEDSVVRALVANALVEVVG